MEDSTSILPETANKKRRANDGGVCSAGAVAEGDEKVVTTSVVVPVQQIESAKQLVLHIFRSGDGSAKRWQMLSDEWKSDPDVAFAALSSLPDRHVEKFLLDLPESLQTNRDFLVNMVQLKPHFWEALPSASKGDIALVWAIKKVRTTRLVDAILVRFPNLANDRNFWISKVFAVGPMADEEFA